MITQKDIHNIFVKKLSAELKVEIAKTCEFDVEKIKKFEKGLADSINTSFETSQEAAEYMCKEI